MNTLQKEGIDRWERFMREDATSILRGYNTIKVVDKKAAHRAMSGIIQYLQIPLNIQISLDELEKDWNMGLIDKEYYEKQKAELNDII